MIRYPKNLKKSGRTFWKKVLTEFEIEDFQDFARLNMAAKCLDDIDDAEEQIETDGIFILDRYGQKKENPAGKVVRENRIIFCRIVRELNLDIQPPESRLPRKY